MYDIIIHLQQLIQLCASSDICVIVSVCMLVMSPLDQVTCWMETVSDFRCGTGALSLIIVIAVINVAYDVSMQKTHGFCVCEGAFTRKRIRPNPDKKVANPAVVLHGDAYSPLTPYTF